jgi:regulator of RNase E activity RraA
MEQKVINQWYSTITSEAFMKVITPGTMLVIDAMEDGESRSIGSSNILSWRKLGMVGLVTSGGLADTDEIIYHKTPVWFRRLARGIRPGRNELESVNRPVTIGGVLVRPGDVIVADGDGVVVVPRERAEEVAKAGLFFLDNISRERYIKETGKNPWKKQLVLDNPPGRSFTVTCTIPLRSGGRPSNRAAAHARVGHQAT